MTKNNQNTALNQAENKAIQGNGKVAAPKKKSKWKIKLFLLIVVALIGAGAWLGLQMQQQQRLQNADNGNNDGMAQLQAVYEAKFKELDARVNDLNLEVSRLKNNKPEVVVAADHHEEYEQQLEMLKQRMDERFASLQASAPEPVVVSAADKEVRMKQEILLAAGLMTVRDLAERGLPFAYEAEVLQIMAQGNPQAMKYIEVMQKYAVSGIKGKKMLIKEFNHIYPHLSAQEKPAQEQVAATENETPEEWWNKFPRLALQWLRSLFASQKTVDAPVLDQKEDVVYELVNDGDLAAALNELSTNVVYAQLMNGVLYQWTIQVRGYLEFEKAASGLLMNALANLHLKEMEH